MSIKLIINFDVKNENIEQFEEVLRNIKTNLPLVEGCMGIKIYASSNSNNKFTLVETWQTKENHEQHVNHLIGNGSWDAISKLLINSPTSDYFYEI